MVTMAGTQDTLEGLVRSLLNLEHDALEAYDETIERLDNPVRAEQVREFRDDHLQHIQALESLAQALDVEADGTAKSLLTKGKVVIADLMGDKGILMAMKTNENDTVAAYENALQKDFLTPELRQVCEQGLSDERRHRDWMDREAKSANESEAQSRSNGASYQERANP